MRYRGRFRAIERRLEAAQAALDEPRFFCVVVPPGEFLEDIETREEQAGRLGSRDYIVAFIQHPTTPPLRK